LQPYAFHLARIDVGGSIESSCSSNVRFYWCSKKLLNALLDTYLRADHGSHSLLEVIGRAVMMSDLLPKMLDALCVLPTVPSSRKDCQDTLEVNYDFCLWREKAVTEAISNLPAVLNLCKIISNMVCTTFAHLFAAGNAPCRMHRSYMVRSRRIKSML
jgi:hypothetical protein